ncbi:MAG: cupin domain-containing protein [Hyphomicrobiaceae bacterium]|nr:cupin domain-containing protein [Hyphomicrobiaceae bacterium]
MTRAGGRTVTWTRVGYSVGWTGALAMAAVIGWPVAEARAPSVEHLLSSGRTVLGEAIRYPTGGPARITASIVTLAPGAETGWHTHPTPLLGYMLEGALTVDYGPHGTRTYTAGDAVLEAVDVPHNGRNLGTSPARVLVVVMGADGQPGLDGDKTGRQRGVP